METRDMICIRCPQGCSLKVEIRGKDKIEVEGNRCPKGKAYAIQEIEDPRRVLTTTVKTIFPEVPRLSVSSSCDIPLGDLMDWMAELSKIEVHDQLQPGDTVVKDFLKSGIDLIATQDSRQVETVIRFLE